MLGLEPEFEDLVDIKPGSVYNASEVNGLAKKFTDRLSALGYAFARAIPNPVVDPEIRMKLVSYTRLTPAAEFMFVK